MASTPTKRGAGGAKPRYGAGRIAFLKERDAIKAAIEQGQPLRACFESFRVKLGIGYSQFGRHVATFIRPPKRRKPSGRIEPPAAPQAATVREQTRAPVSTNSGAGHSAKRPASGPGAAIPGFNYQPDSGDKSDLI